MKKEESRFAEANVFEGMTSLRAVLHAMENGVSDRRILRVLVDRDRRKSRAKELAWLEYRAKEFGFDIVEETAEFIDSMTVGNSHGGIVFECTARTLPSLERAEHITGGFWVMLEGIEDPYNFGYALRSLYSCGVDGVVLSPRNWMSAAGVVCRSSAGASEMLPFLVSESGNPAEAFKTRGYKIVCAGIRDSVSSFDAELKKPLLLVVGGEKRGISRGLLDAADLVVRIDYGRAFGGSLSAASAASILGYEILRQNRCDDK
ncbi:MAG: TrmH family RNA methyltransferase [Eubacteriales bacterium]